MIKIDFRFVPVAYYIYATLCSTASPELFICSSYFEDSAISCRQEQNSKRLEEISKLDTDAWEPWNIQRPTEDPARNL